MTRNHITLTTIIRFLGSLYFAIFLIASLTVILIASTSFESQYGTPFAQKIFYQAGWFDVFLGLLAINIFFSTLTRLPFKKKHTGFIITHIGILVLLAGSLMSSLWGVEGQLALYEGEKNSRILQNIYALTVHRDPAKTIQLNLRENFGRIQCSLDAIDPGLKLSVDHVVENARKKWEIKEGGTGVPLNAAVEISLESQRVGAKDKFWLVENNPFEPDSNNISMGPATIILTRGLPAAKTEKTPRNQKNPRLVLKLPGTSENFAIDLSAPHSEDIALGTSGLKIRNLVYYPDARVGENNELVNSSENSSNPAVEFDLFDGKGNKEHVVFFSMFPNFESIHGRSADKITDLKPEIQLPDGAAKPTVSTGPSLTLSTDGNHWFYISRSSKSSLTGEITEGKSYETGWMDFRFIVHKLLSHALVQESIQKTGEGKGYLAAQVSLSKNNQVLWQGWLFEDEPLALENSLKDMELAIRRKNRPLPFSLTLKDFRKVDYPATQNAMSFESDVILEDTAENTIIQKTISMNKPLDYKGYRIFQSSYIQDPVQGEASVFTIAKNPGIRFIYSGACITFLGIITVFFIKPLSSFGKNI